MSAFLFCIKREASNFDRAYSWRYCLLGQNFKSIVRNMAASVLHYFIPPYNLYSGHSWQISGFPEVVLRTTTLNSFYDHI